MSTRRRQRRFAWGGWLAFGLAFVLARPALAVSPEQIAAGDVWIATDAQGSIAGLVALGPGNQAHALDLDKLFVEPRRIRAGVGRRLLSHAIAEARRRGARRLTILSDPFAAGFYQRNGATCIGGAPSDAVPGRMLPLFRDRPRTCSPINGCSAERRGAHMLRS